MNVRGAKIRWNFGWGNNPNLEIWVDKLPPREELRYHRIGGSYLAVKEGYASFYAWGGTPDRGFGGAHIPIKMEDGSLVTLKGPWSSRASAIGAIFDIPLVDASITDEPGVLERGYTFSAGSVTLELALQALGYARMREGGPGMHGDSLSMLPVISFGTEVIWVPAYKHLVEHHRDLDLNNANNRCKHCEHQILFEATEAEMQEFRAVVGRVHGRVPTWVPDQLYIDPADRKSFQQGLWERNAMFGL